MKKTGLFVLIALATFSLMTSCEKEELLENESYIENYKGKSKSKNDKEHKVKLCVQKGNGDWHAIEVAKSAEETHLRRGAIHPGDCIGENKKCNENCVIIDVYESADNGIDDDCDGLVDCDDPDISDSEHCDQCDSDVILASVFTHTTYYGYGNSPGQIPSIITIGQNKCASYSEGSLDNWRLGTMDEYQDIKEKCGIYVRPDREPHPYWPSIPILTSDHENGQPKFYNDNYGSYGIKTIMIACVHER